MKRIVFISLMVLFFLASKAQQTPHSLQFSRVLILNNGTTFTVPSAATNNGINCVWKIVSPGYSTQAVSTVNTITINGTNIHTTGYNQTISYTAPPSPYPMWLPAGTTVQANNNISMLYVIEFIVQ